MARFGINEFASQMVGYGNADGTSTVVVAASGRKVWLHSVSTGAVATGGPSLQILRGDGVTRYWNSAGVATSWVDFVGTQGLNWIVDAFLEDGLALKASGIPPANSGWLVTYKLLT